MHKKIFIVVMILICVLTAGCILTPKTVAGFVNIYNHEIENALEWQVDEDFVQSYVASCSIENLQSDNYGLYNSRKCVFHEGMVQFSGVEPFDGGVIVEFRFHESISSSEIFAMINATILAAGDDYKKVGNKFGYLKETYYNLPGGFNKEITFDDKEYLLAWIDDYIIFRITIPK